MITQIHTQGKNEIKIETAESVEDAKKNNFKEGEYSRYYVNGKLVENYLAMVRFIVDSVQTNKEAFMPQGNLMEMRKDMLLNQNKAIRESMENLKKQYKDMNVPEHILEDIDSAIKKIDERGVRISE